MNLQRLTYEQQKARIEELEAERAKIDNVFRDLINDMEAKLNTSEIEVLPRYIESIGFEKASNVASDMVAPLRKYLDKDFPNAIPGTWKAVSLAGWIEEIESERDDWKSSLDDTLTTIGLILSRPEMTLVGVRDLLQNIMDINHDGSDETTVPRAFEDYAIVALTENWTPLRKGTHGEVVWIFETLYVKFPTITRPQHVHPVTQKNIADCIQLVLENECEYCDGRRYHICDECTGKGKKRDFFGAPNDFFDCEDCKGTGKQACIICNAENGE